MKSQWLHNIKTNLNQLGFSAFLDSQTVGNAKWLTAALKRKLQDQYIQKWPTISNTSSSSTNYRLIKTNFERSSYLKLLPDNLSKKMLAFRTRNHRLPVELGRWVGTALPERTCQYCNNELGDGFHYVLNCNFFTNDRKEFMNRYYYQRPNIIKYSELMNTANKTKLKKLAIFVSKILKIIRG